MRRSCVGLLWFQDPKLLICRFYNTRLGFSISTMLIYLHIIRNVSTAGPKKYITLEEHLQMFDSPERTGQYRKLLIFSVLKYNLIPPPMTEDLS